MLKPGTLPYLTHERFLILSTLVQNGGRMVGEHLRTVLARKGWTPTQPGFSQIMGRAEKSKLIHAEYTPKIVEGVQKRQRIYGITRKGMDHLTESMKFYNP
jgi:hypothetical protein